MVNKKMKSFSVKLLHLIILVMVGCLINACGNSHETQQEKKMENKHTNENSTQEPTLLEILDEPNKWEDDQIHAVNWDKILRLIQAGADINKKTEQNRSIWARVIMAPVPNTEGTNLTKESIQRAQVVEELLKKGVSPEEKLDDNNTTALMYASGEGYLPVVTVLLKYHANVNATDNLGNTALFQASTPHYVTQPGFPPHSISTYEGHLQVIQSLLRAGAAVNHKNKKGKTALSLVTNSDENKVIIPDGFEDMLIGPTNDNLESTEPNFISNKQDDIHVVPSKKQKIIALLKSAGAKE